MRKRDHSNVNCVTICTCAQKSDMKKHVDAVHKNKKPYKCEMCDYSCCHKTSLKMHIDSVHEKRDHSNVKCVTKLVHKKVT